MKRPSYKCKKYYPGGPIIGYVLNPQESQWHGMWYWHMNNWFNPEEFPEYWELIIEKDYEILAFRLKNPNYPDLIRWKNSFGLFPSGENGDINNRFNEFSEESLLKPENGYEIYSVKRKSDGEIFTIGDKISQIKPFIDNRLWKITEFSLKDERCFTAGVNIACIEKAKEPIFTTEDGHEVYGEYTLFMVGITANCYNADYWKVSECKLNFISPPNLVDYKWFYYCVNAEKYIEENKPQFSKKDMIEFANYSTKNFRFDNYPNLDYWINHVKR